MDDVAKQSDDYAGQRETDGGSVGRKQQCAISGSARGLIEDRPLSVPELEIARARVWLTRQIVVGLGSPRVGRRNARQPGPISVIRIREGDDQRIGVTEVGQQLIEPIRKAEKVRWRSLFAAPKDRDEQNDPEMLRHLPQRTWIGHE